MESKPTPHSSRPNERIENTLAGLMFLSWAIMRIASAEDIDRWTLPQVTPAFVHLVVGGLFLIRSTAVLHGDATTLALCLPSFIAGGTAMTLAPESHLWPSHSQALFVVGGIGAVVGMTYLGRNFAVFPAVRTIVVNGPFRLIRHPIYFFELIMIAAACLTTGSWLHGLLFLAAIASTALRIVCEENLLASSEPYAAFCQSVRWRLIPGIW